MGWTNNWERSISRKLIIMDNEIWERVLLGVRIVREAHQNVKKRTVPCEVCQGDTILFGDKDRYDDVWCYCARCEGSGFGEYTHRHWTFELGDRVILKKDIQASVHILHKFDRCVVFGYDDSHSLLLIHNGEFSWVDAENVMLLTGVIDDNRARADTLS